MKLSEYVECLNELIKKNPKVADYDVISTIDDEGNGYNKVHYTPSIGRYESYNEFISFDDAEAFEDNEWTEDDCNAVCIN